MTGYEIPCFSFDMLDPAFLRCLQDIEVPVKASSYPTLVVLHAKSIQALSYVNYSNANPETEAR